MSSLVNVELLDRLEKMDSMEYKASFDDPLV